MITPTEIYTITAAIAITIILGALIKLVYDVVWW